VLFYAGLLTAATLTAFVWALETRPERATTIAFMTLGLAQVFHLGNARSAGAVVSPARIISNPWALAGAGLAGGLQMLAILYAPLRRVLHLTWLEPLDWAVIAACALAPAIAGQVAKTIRAVSSARASVVRQS
jgi:Ca2+-transporting ATPase